MKHSFACFFTCTICLFESFKCLGSLVPWYDAHAWEMTFENPDFFYCPSGETRQCQSTHLWTWNTPAHYKGKCLTVSLKIDQKVSEDSAGNSEVTCTRTSSAQHESKYGNHKDATQTCASKIVESHYLLFSLKWKRVEIVQKNVSTQHAHIEPHSPKHTVLLCSMDREQGTTERGITPHASFCLCACAQLLFTSCSCASVSDLLNYSLETSAHHLFFLSSVWVSSVCTRPCSLVPFYGHQQSVTCAK